MQEVAIKLKELFDESGYRSLDDVRDDVLLILGRDFTPSRETIRQMHTPGGKASKMPDPVVLGVICGLYKQPVQTVSPEVAQVLRTLKLKLGRSIDLREGTLTWYDAGGSQDPLPFDEDQLPAVVDLRDHIVAHVDENEPVELLRIAN